jgi:hypothetical protein
VPSGFSKNSPHALLGASLLTKCVDILLSLEKIVPHLNWSKPLISNISEVWSESLIFQKSVAKMERYKGQFLKNSNTFSWDFPSSIARRSRHRGQGCATSGLGDVFKKRKCEMELKTMYATCLTGIDRAKAHMVGTQLGFLVTKSAFFGHDFRVLPRLLFMPSSA